MKLQPHRFGRSPHTVDEGMGGGDYPVVSSDLSVEHPPVWPSQDLAVESPPVWPSQDLAVESPPVWPSQDLAVESPPVWPTQQAPSDLVVIPQQEYPEEAPQEQYPADGSNFWGQDEHDTKPPRPWWRTRRTYFIATALVAVIAVIATMVAVSGGSSQTKRLTYTFPVEAFPQSGVTVSRTWTLYGGKHPTLHGDLIFYSSRSDQVTVDELLPKSLVQNASQVTFLPKPRVISEDPVVVSYSISSALDGVTSATYNIPLPADSPFTLVALHKWAAEQTAEASQLYLASHTLASIHLTPASIVVKKGGAPYQLAISGLQTDGTAAATVAFGGAKWSVANPKVAKVSDKGLVTGLTPGRTTVRALVGKLSATATVVVSVAPSVKPTPPLKTLAPGPLNGLGPNSFPSSIGVITNGPTTSGHGSSHQPTRPVTGSKPPVVVPPVNPNPPPVTCPTAPPAPQGVTAFETSDTSVAVTWAAPSIPAGCSFSLTGYSVSGTDGVGTPLQAVEAAGVSSASFSGLGAGTATFSVAASYGTVNSVAVGTSVPVTGPPAPPPPPVCDPTTMLAPGGVSPVASTTVAGEVSVSWTSASSISPCPAVTSYTVLVDGGAAGSGLTGNSDVIDSLAGGTHSFAVSALFADGTVLTSAPVSVEATELCSDGTTIAVPESCP